MSFKVQHNLSYTHNTHTSPDTRRTNLVIYDFLLLTLGLVVGLLLATLAMITIIPIPSSALHLHKYLI